ncbi:MAG: protein kinase, partial [Acidobacteria bacterium]|nr:protein kinase [Acidobacteriota bacterium]
ISESFKAFLKGDYKKAGDIHRRKGNLEKALKMYLLAEDYISAAEIESALGRPEKAVEHLLRAGEIEGAARLLIQRKNYKKAAEILAGAQMLKEAAAIAEEGKNYPLAVSLYEKDGRFLEAGFAAHKGGMKPKAVLLLAKAMRDFPLDESIPKHEIFKWREKKKEMARIFEEGGVYDKAAELYENLGFLEAAARCREVAGEKEKAVKLYQKLGFVEKAAELLGKEESEKYLKEAQQLEKQGKLEEAEILYQKGGSKLDLARVKELMGKYVEAANLYKDCRQTEKAAHLYYKGGEFQEAGSALALIGEFNMAMQAYREGGFFFEAAAMAIEAKKWEEAVNFILKKREMIEEIIHKFEALPPEIKSLPRVRIALARLRIETGNLEAASENLKNVEPDPSFAQEPWPDYLKGRIAEALGRNKEAIAFYNKVIRKNYAFEDAQKRLHNIIQKSPSSSFRYQQKEDVFEGLGGKWIKAIDTVLNMPSLLFKSNNEVYSTEEIQDSVVALKPALSLSHPHILALKDIILLEKELYLVYEPFSGTPMAQLLKNGFKPSLFRAVDLIRQILEGVYEAHRRGFLHRQLNTETVLIENERKAKVGGFGMPVPSITSIEQRLKFMPYFSPEARRGAVVSPSSDLYSVGALFYALLFHQDPPMEGFEGLSIKDVEKLKTFPTQVARVLKGLFSFSIVGRFQDASEALQEIKPLEFLPGALIAERYEILREIGKGGMGEVYQVKDLDLDEVVALKMLRIRSGISETERARFLREIKIARKISHPNVIRVYDLGSFKDITFLTMEFIDGPTLSEWVKDSFQKEIPLKERINILYKIAKGLEVAHLLGVIHRDLKPQNVLLNKESEPKIVDFGIAYTEEGADLTLEGRFVGSPKYVSPEQIQGKPLDGRSDIYSFGLLSYFVLTGKEVFTGKTTQEIID